MKSHRRRAALLITLLAAWISLAGACLGPMLVSDAQEVQLGLQVVNEIETNPEFVLLRDAEVDGYINEIAQRIITSSPLQRTFPFTFKVAINEQVNAFALPGGHCYVQTGLIDAAESESELVGVIAHEVNHVTAGHHRNSIANQVLIETAGSIATDQGASEAAVIAGRVVAGVGMLSFSRGQESQADRLGAEAMWNAGWDPRGLSDFFQRLREIQERDPTLIENLLSTHPATVRRIEEINEYIATLPPRSDLTGDTPRFHFIQERVRQLVQSRPTAPTNTTPGKKPY